MTWNRRYVLGGALVIVVIAGATTAISTLRRGFSARDEPTRLEVMAARGARKLAMPSRARLLQDPLPPTPDNLAQGKEFWATSCAVCHANNGSGRTTIGRNIYPKAPDMRLADTQSLSDGELYYTIVNGIRLTAMPAWGPPRRGSEPDENYAEIWRLVQFIRHLPQLTPEEEQQMRKMNPRIPESPPAPEPAKAATGR